MTLRSLLERLVSWRMYIRESALVGRELRRVRREIAQAQVEMDCRKTHDYCLALDYGQDPEGAKFLDRLCGRAAKGESDYKRLLPQKEMLEAELVRIRIMCYGRLG